MVWAALLFKQGIYNPSYGLLNGTITGLTHLFGGHSPVQPAWIQNQPKIMVEAALIWQWTPFMMLILLAGLQSRDSEVMEAALVDGASPWQTFRIFVSAHDYGLASAVGVVVAASLIIADFALRVVSSLLSQEVIR